MARDRACVTKPGATPLAMRHRILCVHTLCSVTGRSEPPRAAHPPALAGRRQELKARFPSKPWLDVCSKADLLEAEFEEADERVAGLGTPPAPPLQLDSAVEWAVHVPGALRVSATTEQGLDTLKLRLSDTVRVALQRLDAWAGGEEM